MFTEKELEMIQDGKIPLIISSDGMPSMAKDAPIFELMLFIRALAKGYMRLFNRNKFLEKCANFYKKGDVS